MVYPISSLRNMEMSLYGSNIGFKNAPSYANNYQMPVNTYNQYYNNGYYQNPTAFGQQIPNAYSNAVYRQPVYNQYPQQTSANAGYPQPTYSQPVTQTYSNPVYSQQVYTQPTQQVQAQNITSLQADTFQPSGGNVPTPTQTQVPSTIFGCLNQEQKEAIVDCYAKNLEPTESFKNAVLMGTVSTTIMQNPRIIAHPWNYLTTTLKKSSDVNKMFSGVRKNGSTMNKLWKENSMILEEAFSQMHRAESRYKSKLGLFRAKYNQKDYEQLKDIMQKALDEAKRTGNIDEVAKATEKLRHAYCNDGWFAKQWNKITKLFGKDTLPTVNKRLGETAKIDSLVTERLKYQNKTLTIGKAFQKTGGWIGLLFGAVEIMMNWSKVKTAQAKDEENAAMGIHTEYGKQQKRQTITKGVGNAIGWAIGETLGVWAYAKVGAAVGTALGPGIGTAIGAAIGFLGGSLGMWLAGKGTKALVGEDVANKIEAENKAKTQEGQLELVQAAAEAMQKGEQINPFAQQAVQQVLTTYA